jgi:hypothetical protein
MPRITEHRSSKNAPWCWKGIAWSEDGALYQTEVRPDFRDGKNMGFQRPLAEVSLEITFR